MPTLQRTASIAAFTLVELLIVVGIIGVLVALLLPAIAAARSEALAIRCAGNVRQLCTGLYMYAAEYNGKYPPNIMWAGTWGGGLARWYDDDRVGRFVGKVPGALRLVGSSSVWICPSDTDDSIRSYGMNVWASCQADSNVVRAVPPYGTLWAANCKNASKTILVTEQWSAVGNYEVGFGSYGNVGSWPSTPGQRFGAGGGIAPPVFEGRWGHVNCELPFIRHRTTAQHGMALLPIGRVNIGYADGHVELKSNADLANPTTGLSSLDSLWSPLDFDTNY